MQPECKHNAEPLQGSNHDGLAPWKCLGEACRLLARRSTGLGDLLALAVEALGAERAFLVCPGRTEAADDFEIAATSSLRPDRLTRPSLSVLRLALGSSRPALLIDLDRAPLGPAVSVRELSLRTAASIPVSLGDRRAALVLDSSHPARIRGPGFAELLAAFGALVEAAAASPRRPERSARADPASAYLDMLAWARKVAGTELPALVRGESGVGKEGVSRALHRWSARSAGPFVAVNCTALTESLLEAELFGAVRGAYTGSDRDRPGLFRLAHLGTLFLDEVGDMPATMQAKLLRALEERRIRPVGSAEEVSVDTRIIAASHRDLPAEVAAGRFRSDLYHRLAVLVIDVPPLRARLDDLPRLIEELSPRLERETGRGPLRIAADAWHTLRSHPWPGNVRELHAVLARALLRTGGAEITPGDLDLPGATQSEAPRQGQERVMIERSLEAYGGNLRAAADEIGWTRQKLYRRMRALGIRRGEERQSP